MTRRTALLNSLVGGGLAALIVIATAAIMGEVSANDVITAVCVGLGSGFGLFLLFKGRLGKRSC